MTYQVLARKWRPQDFSSLVGQEHVVTALRNALTENRIAQAYLFSGIRGVGKTTAARVLAKALNCLNREGGDPCNACDACLETSAGHNLDVIEVDAATYSKVEQVRELTESLRYGPAGKYKVVVLDEVHRLSKQAFDALLKIVEEPPAHLVFIFATTEIDAVPATILSRCQEFQFRRVPSQILADHLRHICQAESIEVSDTALRLIARAGEGSVRDSVALLDQMSTFGSGTISDEDAKKLLGGLDAAIFQKLLASILAGEHGPILEVVADIEANGWDPHNVYSQFLAFCRDALHLSLGSSAETVDLPAEECARLQEMLRPFGYEAMLQAMQLLIASEGMVRRSEFGLLALEITWLRAAELPKVQRLQDYLSGRHPLPQGPDDSSPSQGGPGGPGSTRSASMGAGPASPGRQTSPAAFEARSPEPAGRQIRRAEPGAADSRPATGPGRIEEPLQDGQPHEDTTGSKTVEVVKATVDSARFPALLELIGARRQSLAAHLRSAELIAESSLLTIRGADRMLIRSLDLPRNREILDQSLTAVFGPGCSWSLDGDAPARSSQASSRSRTPSSEAADSLDSGPRRSAPTAQATSRPLEESTAWQGGPSHHLSQRDPQPKQRPAIASRRGRNALPAKDLQAAAELPTVRSVLEIFGGQILSIESEPTEMAAEPEEVAS